MKKLFLFALALVTALLFTSCPQGNSPPEKFTLTFDPAEGTVNPKTLEVTEGKAIGTLPIPTKEGYTCTAWNIDGTTITADTVWNYTENKTAIAVWVENIKYVTATVENNVVTISPATDDSKNQLKTALHTAVDDNNRPTITEIIIEAPANGAKITPEENLSYLFSTHTGPQYRYQSLSTITGLANIDTSIVIDMSYMFNDCTWLQNIDGLSTWDTSRVKNMRCMFAYCSRLTNFDGLNNWDTSNVTSIAQMFISNRFLESIDLSNWNTPSLMEMYGMFFDCNRITSIDLSNWNISSVSATAFMFRGCTSLERLNLSGWDTSNVTAVQYTFYGCTALTSENVTTTGANILPAIQDQIDALPWVESE